MRGRKEAAHVVTARLRERQAADRTSHARDAPKIRVVEDDERAVLRLPHVDLGHDRPAADRLIQRGKRVLRPDGRTRAVRDDLHGKSRIRRGQAGSAKSNAAAAKSAHCPLARSRARSVRRCRAGIAAPDRRPARR